MARPFRFHPPEHSADHVVRARVQEILSGRFDRQVTVLQAGAGFGKTSAIVQAFEESRLRPLGTDHWLACEPGDADARSLMAGLQVVLGDTDRPLGRDRDEWIDRVIERLSSGAPSRQCLVFDDVHHLPADSTGAELLDRLLGRLPANASMLLAGRTRPPLTLRRSELTLECAVVDETQLALQADEVAEMARRRGADAGPAGTTVLAGWPALVTLSLAHDEPAAFVMEEVLDVLDADQHELLRTLLVVGDVDAEVLAAATGVASADPLHHVPLVHRRHGCFGAHDLWESLLPADDSDTDRRRRAIGVLLDHGKAARAIDVALNALRPADLGPDLLRAVRAALLVTAVPAGSDLRRWHRRILAQTPGLADRPAVVLLGAIISRLDNPGSEDCHRGLGRAADLFEAAGDPPGAVSALSALTFALHVRRDVGGLMDTFGRLARLAEAGESSAKPYASLAQAIVATSQSDQRTVLENTRVLLEQPLPNDTRAVALWMHATALGNLGELAVEPAAECAAFDLPLPGISLIHVGARWRAGQIAELLEMSDDVPTGARDRFLTAAWKILISAAVGDTAATSKWLEVFEHTAGDESQWQTAGSVLFPRAAAHLALGDTDAAMAALTEMIEQHPFDGRGREYYLHAIALFYPRFPQLRSWYDEQVDLGPLYQRDLRLNQAYVSIVEQGDAAAARDVELPASPGELMPGLGMQLAVELLAGALEAGNPSATTAIGDLIELVGEPARTEFRRASHSDVPIVAAGARRVVESMPVRPSSSVQLWVLGRSELQIGSRIVESADWRRERVRALLTFLVLHRHTTREQVIAALWPDAEPAAGKRSLRSTLNVLNHVLEPGRVGGDAPFFIRSFGQRLQLVVDHDFSVDAERFTALADEAERLEAAGTPSLSIEPYRSAADAYGGDLLPESYDDWVVFARDRLRSRYVRVAVRCAELLTATGRHDEALVVINPVLTTEPWAESAHRALVSAHLERDDLASARRAMQTCHDVLADVGGPAEPATFELIRRLERV